jgi:hypothetical protein
MVSVSIGRAVKCEFNMCGKSKLLVHQKQPVQTQRVAHLVQWLQTASGGRLIMHGSVLIGGYHANLFVPC